MTRRSITLLILLLIASVRPSSAAAAPAIIFYPPNGAVNVDFTQPFQWSTVPNAQAYYLYVGSTFGAGDLVNTGEIQQPSRVVPALPAGQLLYVRISTKVGGVWRSTDSTFTAAPLTSTMTYPSNGAVNVDMLQPMQWTT